MGTAVSSFRGGRHGSDGRCLFDVVHVLERRTGRQQVAGVWADVWFAEGSYKRVEFAQAAAEAFRSKGFTVRVRPVIL